MKLKLKSMHSCDCIFNNYLILCYDRITDEILLKPCCALIPKANMDIIRVKSEYFINNFEECLENYKKLDLSNLYEYYNGVCGVYHQKFGIDNICNNYTGNHTFTVIENSISAFCNLNCIMCSTHRGYNKREEFLYKEITKKIQNYDKLKEYSFTAFGEPLIYKDLVYDFLENSKCERVNLLTNGSLLNDEDITKLSEYNNLYITVSIDSHIKETYEKIRLGSNFDNIMKNILELKRVKKLAGINYVVQDTNKNEIDDALKYFSELDISIQFLSVDNITRYTSNEKILKYANCINLKKE